MSTEAKRQYDKERYAMRKQTEPDLLQKMNKRSTARYHALKGNSQFIRTKRERCKASHFKHRDRYRPLDNAGHRERYSSRKERVLSHYGRDGKAVCTWGNCSVEDLDMLTLDHVNGGGSKERQSTTRP